ncbi:peptidylprolyl isomerase [Lampropedia aestuarii]|nr:peptidylprolyl isomerase [Lampropedia aestuarii]
MAKPLISGAAVCAALALGTAAQAQVLVHGAGEQPVEITVLDLQADAARLDPTSRTFALSEKARIEGAARGLLVRSSLAQQAKASGLDQSPVAQKRLEQAQQTVLMELLMEEAAQQALPSEADLLKYAQTVYKNEQSSFTTQGELAASHILIAGDSAASKEKIDALYALIQSGSDFGDLAFKESQDPASAAQHGSLGYFPEGKMIPEFEAELKTLKQGEISKPFKTAYGWHIARLDGAHAKGQLSFDDVKERLMDEAKNRIIKERRDALVQAVLDHAVVNQEAIAAIAEDNQAKAKAAAKP